MIPSIDSRVSRAGNSYSNDGNSQFSAHSRPAPLLQPLRAGQAGVGGGARLQGGQPSGGRRHGLPGEEQEGGVSVGEGQHANRRVQGEVRVGRGHEDGGLLPQDPQRQLRLRQRGLGVPGHRQQLQGERHSHLASGKSRRQR